MRLKHKPLRKNVPGHKRPTALNRDGLETLLFVYGTLKREGIFHNELSNKPGVTYLGNAHIKGKLYKLHGEEFPAAIPSSEPNSFVYGQLFSMKHPDATLPALDDFEEVDRGLFHRELVNVWFEGARRKAWAYFYNQHVDKNQLVESGTYKT
jgi:gamma-glutamylcyclotransferase (GGCT)/AIG2-like uncharacterized protein YtfP